MIFLGKPIKRILKANGRHYQLSSITQANAFGQLSYEPDCKGLTDVTNAYAALRVRHAVQYFPSVSSVMHCHVRANKDAASSSHGHMREQQIGTSMNAPSLSLYKIEAGTGQHIGDRIEQQDRVALFGAPRAPGYMMAVVADGMGGLSGGAMAAEQVIRTAKQAFDLFSPQTDDVERLLTGIARDAHTIIKLTAISSEKKPHSTVVVLVVSPGRTAFWIHVGDSRLYRFSGPNCAERTIDHSYVEALVAEGKLTREAATGHHLSNVLVNALGSHDNEPEISMRRYDGLKAGDAFLLCSDGLWQYFSDAELGVAVAVNPPRQASELLIRKARERAAGAGDNCTLAIVKLAAPPQEAKNYTVERMRRAV
jgi:PPM family protein phosphatase